MRDIIRALVLLVEDGQIHPLLEETDKQYGSENVRLFSIELLAWLRSDLLVPRQKGVKYYDRPAWFSDFSLFVQHLNELNDLFSCTNYSIDFREEVPYIERMEIHQYVAENHKPPLLITYR